MSNVIESVLPMPVPAVGASPRDRFQWVSGQKGQLEQELRRHGALLFTELGAQTLELFQEFSEILCPTSLSYAGGDSPRTKLSAGVYTSTEYPAEYAISLHNELSYAAAWPTHVLFCCITPASEGGETPLADSRKIIRALDPALLDEFTRRQVRYIRNLHDGSGFGRSWQDTFETDDRAQVERHCTAMGTEFTWQPDGGLRMTTLRPAVATHPVTGELVWFNQADQFHPSTYPKPLYTSLMELYGDDPTTLPSYVTFGDGAPIPTEMFDAIRRTIAELTVTFPWRRGEALWVDNMLICHGRAPFSGDRRILVAMS